jgi:hypothetical protein
MLEAAAAGRSHSNDCLNELGAAAVTEPERCLEQFRSWCDIMALSLLLNAIVQCDDQ